MCWIPLSDALLQTYLLSIKPIPRPVFTSAPILMQRPFTSRSTRSHGTHLGDLSLRCGKSVLPSVPQSTKMLEFLILLSTKDSGRKHKSHAAPKENFKMLCNVINTMNLHITGTDSILVGFEEQKQI